MRGELVLSVSTLLGFLLTLVRVAGVFVFVPIPGVSSVAQPGARHSGAGHHHRSVSRVAAGRRPRLRPGCSLLWIMVEAALGIGIGLAVAFVSEAFAVGAQVMGLQAGYAFASTIDPEHAGRFDRAGGLRAACRRAAVLRHRARPRGAAHFRAQPGNLPGGLVRADARRRRRKCWPSGRTMFRTGLRLALPMIAVLVMVDISLALLGRVNAQLQLLTIAFPVKMMVGLVLLGWLALLLPALCSAPSADASFAAVRRPDRPVEAMADKAAKDRTTHPAAHEEGARRRQFSHAPASSSAPCSSWPSSA